MIREGWSRIRAWWHRATHAPCPVCGTELHVGREWQGHKAAHDRQEWRRSLGLTGERAMSTQPGEQPEFEVINGWAHIHRHEGQELRHSHLDGDQPHDYHEDPRDRNDPDLKENER